MTGGLPVSVSGLCVTGAGGRVLLSVSSLALPPGALVGVRGPSGAGKSTLLYALAGLIAARGRVCWGDTDIMPLSAEKRARFRAGNIGMIFQDFLLFEELGAGDNAALSALFLPRAQRRELRARADARLSALGLGNHAGRSVASFSGGERQRVAIARAMASGAPVLLADEPTASLDRGTADRLTADLIGLVRGNGTTLVVVTHDARLIDRMDRVLTIADGALVSDEAAPHGLE
ncbi:ABC transporter ATP-binding protein [Salipiger aestuarii]|uniref:Putative ABC transport system ATP-binding protein n=1 Tax=Salipiger aestuarii TaxID=568098 RepID=A0A327YK50_9RHOB|nr:ATP-binding cassette domain-containing protein [Salipiger aestuarii]KAA8609255.1 ABC transporter ATP-binding protein [Salipiger aestuarii]KAA8615208.1 ABC transporter ATP-binding protein [Salipiger aestuarii]KAB2542866.1 ABC transporter ATP-binding protein [Salipiger aestuarii]RAK20782.1 putative ABC transport system ATP-binding protein [Salipiger aestuarii]